MTDHTQEERTLEHDAQPQDTATDQSAVSGVPEKDTLLAGKYQSKDELVKATVELARQVDGKDPTADQVIDWSSKDTDSLVSAYKGLERQFHTQGQKQDTPESSQEDVDRYLDKWAKDNGFVRRQDIEAQKYEEQELNSLFSQKPEARQREDLIKSLANTDAFKNKSYAEVDAFIEKQLIQSGDTRASRPSKMGSTVAAGTVEKTLDSISDEDFAELIGANDDYGRSSRIRK